MEKIAGLKEKTDEEMVKEPLEKMKERMKHKNLRFSIKTVTEQKVMRAMDDMKKKK